MEPRVEHLAKELARALADSEVYAALQKARGEMEKHTAAQIMLRDLRERQERLQEKSRQGQEISKAEIADFQRMSQVAAMNPYVHQLVDAEMALANTMMQIQELLAQAVGLEVAPPQEDEADGEAAAAPPAPEEGTTSQTRSRLWVPGS